MPRQSLHSPVWMRPELLSPMLKNCSMSGRTPGKQTQDGLRQVASPSGPRSLPSSNLLPEVGTSHGEAVHVIEEVDVAQHGHYESRAARRQARDALQPLPVRDLGIDPYCLSWTVSELSLICSQIHPNRFCLTALGTLRHISWLHLSETVT